MRISHSMSASAAGAVLLVAALVLSTAGPALAAGDPVSVPVAAGQTRACPPIPVLPTPVPLRHGPRSATPWATLSDDRAAAYAAVAPRLRAGYARSGHPAAGAVWPEDSYLV